MEEKTNLPKVKENSTREKLDTKGIEEIDKLMEKVQDDWENFVANNKEKNKIEEAAKTIFLPRLQDISDKRDDFIRKHVKKTGDIFSALDILDYQKEKVIQDIQRTRPELTLKESENLFWKITEELHVRATTNAGNESLKVPNNEPPQWTEH